MLLIKVGGGEGINLAGIARDLAELDQRTILVHGANALRDRLASELGTEIRTVTSVSGYSSVQSDDQTLDLMMMAYAGLRNKRFVELLQRYGVNAVGLSGLDGRVVEGRRNRGIRVRDNGKLKLVRDLSGRASTINRQLLDLLLSNNFTPVLTMPILDENGIAVNSENDDVLTLLQEAYRARQVIQLIEAPGLLADADDPSSLVPNLSRAELEVWEESATGRMRRKLRAMVGLFNGAPTRVTIADGTRHRPVVDALAGQGTVIE
jgi:acetylglutamate/LysW-gamma-L-alpha-aminoadipate kinase